MDFECSASRPRRFVAARTSLTWHPHVFEKLMLINFTTVFFSRRETAL